MANVFQRLLQAGRKIAKRLVDLPREAVERTVGAAKNVLELLLGRERQETPKVKDAPEGADYRRTFYLPEDAEAYAAEIPVPTVIVVRPIEPDEQGLVFDDDDTDDFAYDVFITYEDVS